MTLEDLATFASSRISPERLELFLVEEVAPLITQLEVGNVDIDENYKNTVVTRLVMWLFEGYQTGDEDKFIEDKSTSTGDVGKVR